MQGFFVFGIPVAPRCLSAVKGSVSIHLLGDYASGAVNELLAALSPSVPLQGDLRIGALEVRLAKTVEEVQAAQKLRYQAFYLERNAAAPAEVAASQRDFDEFDEHCDHMLVLDHNQPTMAQQVVGTYRLLRRSVAEQKGGFYTQTEFDISGLLAHEGEILEVGRSCVAAPYRTRMTLDLLWRGIAAYVFQHDIQLIFGCASLSGTNLISLADQLYYLYEHHLAPPAIRPRAREEFYVPMAGSKPPENYNAKKALNALPPLIKGYLRLGGFIGDGAVLDHVFDFTDVCLVVKTDLITNKYAKHYGLTE